MKENKTYFFPWLTLFLSLISIIIYSVFTYYSWNDQATPELYSMIGAPSAIEIYDGQSWGVIMNSFLHNRIEILLANLAGLWILGSFLEKRLKFRGLFPLGLFASAATSIIQLTLTDNPGIGMTGVNYFFFFFILTKGLKQEEFRMKGRFIIMPVLVVFLLWCWYMDRFHGWYMAVESMAAGVLLGALTGLLSAIPYKPVYIGVILSVFAGLFSFIYYAPWSADWNVSKAIKLHSKGKTKEARKYYDKALYINPENENATSNLFIIKIDELSEKAFRSHSKQDYLKARFYYEQILKLEPSNAWAKAQLQKLP